MRILMGFVVVAVVGLIVPDAHAVPVDSYQITAGSGLQYLDHDRYYKWGINTPWDVSRTPISASLTFTSLENWRVEPNRFYLDLLPQPALGVNSGYDNEASMTDWFVDHSIGIQLAAYADLPATPTTLVYNFTSDELNTLKTYAADGRFGIGVDPDCHFSNCGVSLDVCFPRTPPVPLPPAVLLAIPGFAAIWAVRRAQRKA